MTPDELAPSWARGCYPDALAAFLGHALDVVAPVRVAAWTTGADERSVGVALEEAVKALTYAKAYLDAEIAIMAEADRLDAERDEAVRRARETAS